MHWPFASATGESPRLQSRLCNSSGARVSLQSSPLRLQSDPSRSNLHPLRLQRHPSTWTAYFSTCKRADCRSKSVFASSHFVCASSTGGSVELQNRFVSSPRGSDGQTRVSAAIPWISSGSRLRSGDSTRGGSWSHRSWSTSTRQPARAHFLCGSSTCGGYALAILCATLHRGGSSLHLNGVTSHRDDAVSLEPSNG
jgi:hypothetical protein